MYTPRSFQQEDTNALRRVMESYPFAILISQRDGEPFATHLPLTWTPGGEHGVLLGHMARANPHWKTWDSATRVLIIFSGPHSYISPAWYEQQVTVPTWNYVTVHAYGMPVLMHEPGRLRRLVTDLTRRYESGNDGWAVERAEPIMETELKAIVGFEIAIDRIEGKFKLNQNRSEADQRGVIRALEGSADRDQGEIAELMRQNLSNAKESPR
ncbi:MAG TPA: FMN-binding negative transcriptional regulator [Gemmatimonadales bacterium]|nr:FMN-binding negative transcriptional regulator [Gemmatimonadales bacterium]